MRNGKVDVVGFEGEEEAAHEDGGGVVGHGTVVEVEAFEVLDGRADDWG